MVLDRKHNFSQKSQYVDSQIEKDLQFFRADYLQRKKDLYELKRQVHMKGGHRNQKSAGPDAGWQKSRNENEALRLHDSKETDEQGPHARARFGNDPVKQGQ
jgi:hypothetical protein